uniref:Rho-related GTP-binding protein RhoF-like n=1 Tax=Erpetoichthys calabaricus TaxID=27687 RepID=A0A8C4SDX0_ERPCA
RCARVTFSPRTERNTEGPSIKTVIVGDGGSGKTSLLVTFARGEFLEDYIPTVFERYTANVTSGSQKAEVHLWDTAGQEEYDRLRPLSYTGANVVLICYDVTNPNSYENVLTKWHPEVKHFCRGVPFLLVGCKTDLRKDKIHLRKLRESGFEPITYSQVNQSAYYQLTAAMYLECSSRLQENVAAIFSEVVILASSSEKRQKYKCRNVSGCAVF